MTVQIASDITNQFKEKWLEYALKYLDYGFSIIPIGPNKQPLLGWKEYQNRKPSVEELKNWCELNNLQGIAVITGKISGIFVLDIDEGGIIKEELPITPKVRTGKGIHHYFRFPENIEIKNRTALRPHVDIRGEGGYAILPPTIHPNGNEYKWLVDLDTPIANAPEWLIKELQDKDGNSGPLTPQIYKGVDDGNRNSVSAHIIGKLLAGLKPEDWWTVAWPLVEAWNDKNIPPIEINKLVATFKSISSSEIKDQSKSHHIYTGDAVTNDISFFTLKELMENEAIKTSWLVDQLIPEQGITCLVARMKTGKSFLTLQIAQSLTQGTELFGKFNVKKTGVFIINKEDDEKLIKERINQLRVDKNLPIVFSTDQNIFFHNNKYIQKILEFTKKHNIGLIIADSLRRFFTGDENSSMEIRPLHQFFKQLTQKGLTVLFTHHYGKDLDGKNDGDKLRGSSDIGAMIDSAIALERSDDGKYLKVIQLESRYTKKHVPFFISFPTFENDDYQFHFLNSVEEEKTLDSKIKEDVLDLLKPPCEKLYSAQIETLLNQKSSTKCSHGTVSKVLGELTQTNQVIAKPEGIKIYYSLPQDQPSQSQSINTPDRVTRRGTTAMEMIARQDMLMNFQEKVAFPGEDSKKAEEFFKS